MRPLLRKEAVNVYLLFTKLLRCNSGGIFPMNQNSYYLLTRTASQLPRLSVTFQRKVLSPSSSFLIKIFIYFIIVTRQRVVKTNFFKNVFHRISSYYSDMCTRKSISASVRISLWFNSINSNGGMYSPFTNV